MTAPTEKPRSCPPPRWADLRDTAPEIADDLVDLWARVEQSTDLRRLVEHLGALIESTLAELAPWRDEDLGVDVHPADAAEPVFDVDDWRTVAPGRWENDNDEFEASIDVSTTGYWSWRWQLWHRNTAGELVLVDHGTSQTLADAQRQTDTRAQRDRNWRSHP